MPKRILVIIPLASILVMAGSASAEPWAGAWALEFQVRPTFLGYNDPGVGIAAKHHFSQRTGVRAGFTVWTGSFDTDGTERGTHSSPFDSSSFIISSTEDSENRNISVFAHIVRNLGVGNRIVAFVEAGPAVRRTVSGDARVDRRTQTNSTAFDDTRTSYFDTHSWDYGAEAQGGFEWFVRSRMSIAARYGVSAMWTRIESHQEYTLGDPNNFEIRSRDTTRHGFGIGTSAATFSLIAYW